MKLKRPAALFLAAVMCASTAGCGFGTASTEPVEYLTELPDVSNGEYPAAFDLRDYGYVTPVKSQGELGACWAFATIAAVESAILSETRTTCTDSGLDLSEHHLFWFSKQHLPAAGEDGYDASNTQSGEGFYCASAADDSWSSGLDTYSAMLTLASGTGAVTEAEAPYQAANGSQSASGDWSLSEDLRFASDYTLDAAYMLPDFKADGDTLNTEGIAAVKQMLTQGRAVAVSYAYNSEEETAANGDSSAYLNSRTYAHYAYEAAASNHCVTIVGWDDSYSRENFNSGAQPAGDGAWIVKNSWGASTEAKPNRGNWGVDGSGYFYLSYYDQSVGCAVAYDVDTTAGGSAYAVTQQYDYLGACALPEEYTEKVSAANVFTAPQDMVLQAVGTMAAAANTAVTVEVYLLDDDSDTPVSDTPAATLQREYPYAGYYREALDTPVALSAGQRYSVVVTQQSLTDENTYYLQHAQSVQGADSLIAMFLGSYYQGVVNPGESWVCFGTQDWQDFTEYLAKLNGDDTGSVADDNFCIKAFGN